MFVMKHTLGISLTPVMDAQGIWAGIWLRSDAASAEALCAFCPQLAEGTGELRMFLNAALPEACFDNLPAQRTMRVMEAGQAPPSGTAVTLGREFAVGVADAAAFAAARAAGAKWFCGGYLAHPPAATGMRDANRAVLLKLLSLIAEDADSSEIEQVFKREPGLSYNLFRLVNSVSMGLSTKVSTFNQAIMVLGRRQMQRWIQLMLYTSNQAHSDTADTLLQLAAMRARLMECLAKASGADAATQERAFMVGIFSLLDSLLGMGMEDIAKAIPLPEDVRAALLRQDGPLTALYNWVDGLQGGADAVPPAAQQAMGASGYADCQLNALRWATGINQDMGQA